jgi:hypothetical protein
VAEFHRMVRTRHYGADGPLYCARLAGETPQRFISRHGPDIAPKVSEIRLERIPHGGDDPRLRA